MSNGILKKLLALLSVCWLPGLLFPITGSGQGNSFSFDYFSQEDGLSNNQVHSIFQDSRGFMWFGTSQGLSRFDGYRFTRFVSHPGDTTSLQGNLVRVIFEDSGGNLYAGTENGGLNLFDRNQEIFVPLFTLPEGNGTALPSVNDIREDGQNRLWLALDNGLMLLKPGSTPERISPRTRNGSRSFEGAYVRVMTFGHDGKLWLGTNNGVFLLDTSTLVVSSVALPLPPSLNEEIWAMFTDDDGRIWTGTYDNGIFIFGKEGNLETHFFPDPENPRSRTVRAIAKNKRGNYWIGTRGGLYIYSPGKGITGYYHHDEREARSLSGNSVLDIFHDRNGDTWIGTRTGINFLVHSKQQFRNFRAMPNDHRYLNSSEIWAFHQSEDGRIWIGTEDGGVNIYNPGSQTFDYITSSPDQQGGLSSNCIKSFLDDGKGNLMIATFRGGINLLNYKSGRITQLRNIPGVETSLSDDRVWCLFRDSGGGIWVGTSSGMEKYNPANQTFIPFREVEGKTQVNWIREDRQNNLWIGTTSELLVFNSHSGAMHRYHEISRDFLEDSSGRIWIATLNRGIALYSVEQGAVRYFMESDGLANNQAISLLEDNNRFIWIGTTNGLSRFNPETGYFQTFSARDGLQNSQFNYGAALKTDSRELLFGGISGFNIFDPLQFISQNTGSPIVLTELRLFNKKVEIGDRRKPILTKSITETNSVSIPFDQKVITIEFAALNYVNSQNNLYSYFLDGFDNAWTDPSPLRSATYTNLNPGEYTFHVKSVLPGVPDAGNDLSLKINIQPPFRKTGVFKFLVLLLFTLLFYALIRFMINREKLKSELAFERMKARKLHELDMLKLSFFTNISHEIRTPLTLILGPLGKLRNRQVPPEEFNSLLEIMHRNARQLNHLINQILDFQKLESGRLSTEFTDGELVSFIRGVLAQFDHLAREKEIDYSFTSLVDKLYCRFDSDKTEKILSNLLSNALKFTGKGGTVAVSLALVINKSHNEQENGGEPDHFIELAVKDSGKGIPETHIDKIFTRFFQSDEKNDFPGTGIGLSMVHELVKLLEGEILVSSKPGEGSRFTVRLPYLEPETPPPNLTLHKLAAADENHIQTIADEEKKSREVIMLVVEDNADVRLFIRNHFEKSCTVAEASDGQQGWEEALKIIPDIIISDILMPGIDGYQLLKMIKNDERTSHIPVILLTALNSRENEMEGVTAGADDYIVKPFDINLLQAKIENILAARQALKEKFSEEIILQPRNILITTYDERFLKKVVEIVENNIADPDFDIESFSSEAGVSRMQLYRKLAALTDMTAKEFIRDIRLQRAAQLLIQKQMNISEIAWATGFRDISHFRKCFRRKYGMSATRYAGNQQEEQ